MKLWKFKKEEKIIFWYLDISNLKINKKHDKNS